MYEAQYDDDGKKIPLPHSVIDAVVAMLLRFQIFCADFQVPPFQIRVLATEATRNALNSDELLEKILTKTGLRVEILTQQDEGEVGAWGVASSFMTMRGLVMDLGGGSTQITWMITKDGHLKTSRKGAISFPYGAAAMTLKLKELEKGKSKHEAHKAIAAFREEVIANLQRAYRELELPQDLVHDAQANGGFPIYLTGGGFRGWGYLLLHQSQVHGNKYPISIINGFTAHKEAFKDHETLKKVARSAHKIFRVSDRRRHQVPAVAFLVNALAEAIPHGIREAHFCQGGVREGFFFERLPPEIRAQDPLEVATIAFAQPLATRLSELLLAALPSPHQHAASATSPARVPASITSHILCATANMFYVHASMTKEISSTSALYTTSTGYLASAHGVSHIDRALLALILEARYEGEIAPREQDYRSSLRSLLTDEEVWWTTYIGSVALVLSRIYPVGIAEDGLDGWPANQKPKLETSARWRSDGIKTWLELTFGLRWHAKNQGDPMRIRETLEGHARVITNVGKKKNAISGWRIPTEVFVRDLDPI